MPQLPHSIFITSHSDYTRSWLKLQLRIIFPRLGYTAQAENAHILLSVGILRKSFFIGSNFSILSSQIVEILEFTNSVIIIIRTRHACNRSCIWGFHSKNSANNATNTSKIDLCTIYTQYIKMCVNWLFQPLIWDEKWEGQSHLGLKITKQRKTCTSINSFLCIILYPWYYAISANNFIYLHCVQTLVA